MRIVGLNSVENVVGSRVNKCFLVRRQLESIFRKSERIIIFLKYEVDLQTNILT